MTLIQYILLLMILIFGWRLWNKYKARELGVVEFVSWLAFWLLAAVIVAAPDLSSYLAAVAGVGRGSDLVLYIGLVLAFWLIFRVYVRLEKFERDLTAVVRGLAGDNKAEPPKPEQNNSSPD